MNHYDEAERLLKSSQSDHMLAAAIAHAILAVADAFTEGDE